MAPSFTVTEDKEGPEDKTREERPGKQEERRLGSDPWGTAGGETGREGPKTL